MKKRVLLLVLILSIFCSCFCACGDTPDDGDNDSVCYMYELTADHVLKRFDLVTRKTTVACPDPLCEHGENCPVNGISYLEYTSEQRIYFSKAWDTQLYCYDIDTGTIELIFTAEGQISHRLKAVDGVIYFSASTYQRDTNGTLKKEVWDVYAYFQDTRQVQKQNETSFADAPILVRVSQTQEQQTKLAWKMADTYFETDMQFQNRQELEKAPPTMQNQNGFYQYTFATRPSAANGKMVYDLLRQNLETKETETLVADVATFRAIRDERETLIGFIYNLDADREEYRSVYLVLFSDSTPTKLFTLPSGYSTGPIYADYGSSLQKGDYVGFHVRKEDDPEFGNWSLYVVDLRTKEGFFITK